MRMYQLLAAFNLIIDYLFTSDRIEISLSWRTNYIENDVDLIQVYLVAVKDIAHHGRQGGRHTQHFSRGRGGYPCINSKVSRIQCFPGNIGLLDSISAKMQPTDHTSTAQRDKSYFGQRIK